MTLLWWKRKPDDAVATALRNIQTQLAAAIAAEGKATRMQIEELVARLKLENEALLAAVAKAQTIEQSVETYVKGQNDQLAILREQIAELLQSQGIPDETVKPILDSVDAQISASSDVLDKIGAAVVQNSAPTDEPSDAQPSAQPANDGTAAATSGN